MQKMDKRDRPRSKMRKSNKEASPALTSFARRESSFVPAGRSRSRTTTSTSASSSSTEASGSTSTERLCAPQSRKNRKSKGARSHPYASASRPAKNIEVIVIPDEEDEFQLTSTSTSSSSAAIGSAYDHEDEVSSLPTSIVPAPLANSYFAHSHPTHSSSTEYSGLYYETAGTTSLPLFEDATHSSPVAYFPDQNWYEITGAPCSSPSEDDLERPPSLELIEEEWSQFLQSDLVPQINLINLNLPAPQTNMDLSIYLEPPPMLGFAPPPIPTDLSSLSEEELLQLLHDSAPKWSNPFPSPPSSPNVDFAIPRDLSPPPAATAKIWRELMFGAPQESRDLDTLLSDFV